MARIYPRLFAGFAQRSISIAAVATVLAFVVGPFRCSPM